MNLGMTMVLGWLLGMEHALDADHVVAVSTIASRSKNLWQAGLIGIFWGLGHTVTLLLMCLLVVAFHIHLSPLFGFSMEFAVGVVLVLLGTGILLDYLKRKAHAHPHAHGASCHSHLHFHDPNAGHGHDHGLKYRARALGIGAVHGLAGSGALMVLVASRLDTWQMALVYVGVFGFGSILSMLLISGLLSVPFLLVEGWSGDLHRRIRLLTGTVSIALGLFIMWNIGVIAGLFRVGS